MNNLFANALYLRLYCENETEFFTMFTPDSTDYSRLDNADKAIAEIMAEREEDMPFEWNENGYIDFESAFEALIEIADNIKRRMPAMAIFNMKECLNDSVRWCTFCGKPMNEGFYFADTYCHRYACSDDCRNKYYKEVYSAKDDEEAHKMYLLDCYEISGDKYPHLCTGNDMDINHIREQTGRHPQDLTLKELIDVIEDNSFEVGDYAYYTNWN